ncbi:MAG TPA: S8 family serine peptidase [Chloroflexota bacterium]|jgi:subtilisin family serine protease
MSAWMQDLAEAWAWGESRGDGIKVAVLDSGIDASHIAVGRVDGYVSVQMDSTGVEYRGEPHADAFGHGTACAGIIRSIAPECELYSIQVLGGALSGSAARLTAGLRWAIEHGMHICNLSLGTTRLEFRAELQDLADLARSRNVVLIAAANNFAVPSYPSSCASVIGVGAHADLRPLQIATLSQPTAEFGARGIDVRVAWLNGEWRRMTGNSYAAPHLTGLVARILSKHRGLRPFDLETVLHALAVDPLIHAKEVHSTTITR